MEFSVGSSVFRVTDQPLIFTFSSSEDPTKANEGHEGLTRLFYTGSRPEKGRFVRHLPRRSPIAELAPIPTAGIETYKGPLWMPFGPHLDPRDGANLKIRLFII